MTEILALILAYGLGSVDFGVIVPRALGVDIYESGSGNPGTSNVFRTLGTRAAAVVMLGDAAKGLAAAALGSTLGDPTLGVACGLAAVLGHVFPVWHRFRGGRGVATAIGAALWLVPVGGILLAAGWGTAVAVTRTASVASLVAMALYVPIFAISGFRGLPLLLSAAIAAVVILRHSGNIGRLVGGGERKIDTR